MPRKAIDYSRTIMYKFVCKDLLVTKCYVGHTTNFINRKRLHKTRCNKKNNDRYNTYIYIFIRENGGFENFDMIEIEKYPCLDVNEAHRRERYWIETLNAELNQVMPIRTKDEHIEYQKEWVENNRDKKNKASYKYFENNRDEINKKRREQYIQNKEYKRDWDYKNSKVILELINKSILPRHIYLYRPIMKEMLVTYFKKRVIKKYNRTELITLSYDNIKN